jgi:hypothetical protein
MVTAQHIDRRCGHAVRGGAADLRSWADTGPRRACAGLALTGVMAATAAVPFLARPGEREPATLRAHGGA